MKKHLKTLKKSRLFFAMEEAEIQAMLQCLEAKTADYKKGEIILRTGDVVTSVGLVLAGSVHIQREDFWGNRTILAEIPSSGIFGESYACAPGRTVPVDAVAAQNSTVLFLDIRRVITTCASSCVFHTRLVQNLIAVLADKNVMLTDKIAHISQRSVREKLLSYLSEQARMTQSGSFTIPFNRQQLADYLCVDRSAMSNMLGKLRDEGVLTFDKAQFELL